VGHRTRQLATQQQRPVIPAPSAPVKAAHVRPISLATTRRPGMAHSSAKADLQPGHLEPGPGPIWNNEEAGTPLNVSRVAGVRAQALGRSHSSTRNPDLILKAAAAMAASCGGLPLRPLTRCAGPWARCLLVTKATRGRPYNGQAGQKRATPGSDCVDVEGAALRSTALTCTVPIQAGPMRVWAGTSSRHTPQRGPALSAPGGRARKRPAGGHLTRLARCGRRSEPATSPVGVGMETATTLQKPPPPALVSCRQSSTRQGHVL